MDTQVLKELIINATTAVLGLLAAYGINAIHRWTAKVIAETSKVKGEEHRMLILGAISDVEMLVTKTVAMIEQTTAKALREAVKNGEADPAKLKELANQAYFEVKDQVSSDTRKLLNEQFGDYSKFVIDTIEQKVLELKRNAVADS